MSGLTILLLVALRVAIGWHFFNEGRDHYLHHEKGPEAKRWSSEGFLKIATGPFAEQAKGTLPQYHHWDQYIGSAFDDEKFKTAYDWYNDVKSSDSSKKPQQPKPEEPGPNASSDQTVKKPDAALNSELDKTPRQIALENLKKLKEENKAAQQEFAEQLKKLTDAQKKPAAEEKKLDGPKKDAAAEKKAEAPKEIAPDLTLLADGHPMYVNPISGEWAKMVRNDWQATVSEAERHYGYNEEQKLLAKKELVRHLEILNGKLENLEKDLFEYRAELRRYNTLVSTKGSNEVPFEKDRVAAKKKELAGKPGSWRSDLMGVEGWLRDSLNGIAGSEAVSKNPLPEVVPTYKKIDSYVIWLLMIGGGCMVLGLFTRLAAFALGTFLLSVVLLQPFWVADAVKTTYFEWVEVLACYALATTGIGRYCGLDYFLHALFGGKPAPEIVKTERTIVTKRA
jgi:uncharacterized membrane protein YphA (DoxX/SURF4 family)